MIAGHLAWVPFARVCWSGFEHSHFYCCTQFTKEHFHKAMNGCFAYLRGLLSMMLSHCMRDGLLWGRGLSLACLCFFKSTNGILKLLIQWCFTDWLHLIDLDFVWLLRTILKSFDTYHFLMSFINYSLYFNCSNQDCIFEG